MGIFTSECNNMIEFYANFMRRKGMKIVLILVLVFLCGCTSDKADKFYLSEAACMLNGTWSGSLSTDWIYINEDDNDCDTLHTLYTSIRQPNFVRNICLFSSIQNRNINKSYTVDELSRYPGRVEITFIITHNGYRHRVKIDIEVLDNSENMQMVIDGRPYKKTDEIQAEGYYGRYVVNSVNTDKGEKNLIESLTLAADPRDIYFVINGKPYHFKEYHDIEW